jgi:hypothetical protein
MHMSVGYKEVASLLRQGLVGVWSRTTAWMIRRGPSYCRQPVLTVEGNS